MEVNEPEGDIAGDGGKREDPQLPLGEANVTQLAGYDMAGKLWTFGDAGAVPHANNVRDRHTASGD